MYRFSEKNCSLHLVILLFLFAALLSSPIIVISTMAAVIDGTDSDNSLYGTMADDTIKGKGENDNLYGNGGNDDISGGSGDDFIQGDADNDNLNGNDGNDYVQGGSGIDTINGGPGNDTLISSFVTASTSVRDFEPDTIICGDGFDTAFINLADNDTASSDCEIIVSTPATPLENQTLLDGNKTVQSQPSIPFSNETLVFPLA
jgi:Ca2+-binding RTX toxin-like protein